MPKTIRVAKYDGRCGWCGDWVRAGEEVARKHGTVVGHPACAKKHKKDERY